VTGHVPAGAGTGWFERLYQEAESVKSTVPWADLRPNDSLLDFWTRRRITREGKTELKVGWGLGDDAEQLAKCGFASTAVESNMLWQICWILRLSRRVAAARCAPPSHSARRRTAADHQRARRGDWQHRLAAVSLRTTTTRSCRPCGGFGQFLQGADIAIPMEEVSWIVFPLNLRQTCVAFPVRSFQRRSQCRRSGS